MKKYIQNCLNVADCRQTNEAGSVLILFHCRKLIRVRRMLLEMTLI